MTMGLGKRGWAQWPATIVLVAAPAGAVVAQESRAVSFNVPAGTLDMALTQVAAQSGRQILFDPAIVRGKSSDGVRGTMPPVSAARQVLRGTGLMLRIGDGGQWMVVRDPATPPPGSSRVLETVRVTTQTSDAAGGANGSSDPLATEGTKSYTTHLAAIASKTPQSLKDTPAAVSVLTRQQLDDRNLNSFSDGLGALPGVTATQSGLFSRGFDINNVQIDGGSPIGIGATATFTSSHQIVDDLSIYDSVTVQRGAAGQFTGVGAPGGVISLERKRPLDHLALEGIAQGGSWNRFRGVIDASAPPMLDGRLRVRTVLAAQSNDEFYDNASRRFVQGYLNIEFAPTSSTRINLGTTINRTRSTPYLGLPTDINGKEFDLPRATCYCTPWSRSIIDSKEAFAQLNQQLGSDWSIRLNTSLKLQDINSDIFNYQSRAGQGIDPNVPSTGFANVYRAFTRSNQYLADAFVTGKFDVAGMNFEFTGGGNFQKIVQSTDTPGLYYYYTNPRLVPFDPAAFVRVDDSLLKPTALMSIDPNYSQEQYGGYATLRWIPVHWLKFNIGERYSAYSQNQKTVTTQDTANNKTRYSKLSPPNVGLVVDITKNVSSFLNYTTIFDRYNYKTATGALVEPTTGQNMEGGIKGSFASGALNASISVFQIRLVNVPDFDPASTYSTDPQDGSSCCYISAGSKYISRGLDLQLQGALTNRLKIDASYTYNDFRYEQGVNSGPYAPRLTQPRHLGKLWAAWQPPILGNKVEFGLGGHIESAIYASLSRYVYDRPTRSFVYQLYTTPRSGYATVDTMMKVALSRRVDIQANLNNLLDKTYYQTVITGVGSYYGTPRSFLLTLRGHI